MSMNVKGYLNKVNRRKFTNNNQKVLFKLLNANGGWISGPELSRTVNCAGSRVRDLRKRQFGAFKVECEAAPALGKRGDGNSFFYRINPRTVNRKQVQTVFGE